MSESFFIPDNGSFKEDRDILDVSRKPGELLDDFMNLARTVLPSKLGSRYTRIVVECLSCFEDERFTRFPHKESPAADVIRAFDDIVLKDLRELVRVVNV